MCWRNTTPTDRLSRRRPGLYTPIRVTCRAPAASRWPASPTAHPRGRRPLVACLYQEYESVPACRHPSSITDDMTSYHAFREIDATRRGHHRNRFPVDDRDLLITAPNWSPAVSPPASCASWKARTICLIQVWDPHVIQSPGTRNHVRNPLSRRQYFWIADLTVGDFVYNFPGYPWGVYRPNKGRIVMSEK